MQRTLAAWCMDRVGAAKGLGDVWTDRLPAPVSAMFPKWTGQTQPQVVMLEGSNLYLGTKSPIKSGGRAVDARLAWCRA